MTAGDGSGVLGARDVGRSVPGVDLLDGVDLLAPSGLMTGIVGPNGSGKSTLARCLAGVTAPDRGTVTLDGADLRTLPRRSVARRLAFVEQQAHTDIDHRVLDVVRLGRLPWRSRLGTLDDDADDICREALTEVGMAGTEQRRWSGLSGGERQRVQIARALAQEPAVLVLDEPLNHLDVHHQFELLDLLAAGPRTVVVVLHDLDLAARYCDHLVVLHGGRVAAAGAPEDVLTPGLLADVFRVRGRTVRTPDGLRVDLHGTTSAEVSGVRRPGPPRTPRTDGP
ncbi:ABC transporter ATP-binding protein [Curtobacterium sp. MCJR17_055]|uniref:ABC transporter ATP-binding protein n=1 Tax=unclassified Curtobacterium TaxID=257496 RepID=UPI000D9C100D|nr:MULTISPECIES: ABC transporter ATP-binding protein [unclassified Curtobacterium]PYY34080.1 ABC transporter ATP-binding protein [Curtobacterium sp. MCBD17_029]PYY53930.1 ABC transporter ATP-binding protein [Curtobacterium sp. MCJR17_055]PYY59183.1 ABC transporter ATP-binding protein [Curtobacterium sp. MCPF17_015]WIB34826.1 ABC transporter ATP-binding protein [Curtobacterium sp. MCJR17_043]